MDASLRTVGDGFFCNSSSSFTRALVLVDEDYTTTPPTPAL
ncbi:MAG: hypothetical protein AAGG07_10530 [Planctomycetota bacterium]